MYASDLGAAIAAPKTSLAQLIAQAKARRAATPVALAVKPVLGRPHGFRPQIAPPVLRVPAVTATVALPQSMPVTTFDAAPATGAPSSGPMIVPTPGADASADGELSRALSTPLLLALAAGAFLLLKRR